MSTLTTCVMCGEILEDERCKVCSPNCQRKAQRRGIGIVHPCLWCGNLTENPLYCSHRCVAFDMQDPSKGGGFRSGQPSSMLGRKQSKDSRKKMSKSQTARSQTPEGKADIMKANRASVRACAELRRTDPVWRAAELEQLAIASAVGRAAQGTSRTSTEERVVFDNVIDRIAPGGFLHNASLSPEKMIRIGTKFPDYSGVGRFGGKAIEYFGEGGHGPHGGGRGNQPRAEHEQERRDYFREHGVDLYVIWYDDPPEQTTRELIEFIYDGVPEGLAIYA